MRSFLPHTCASWCWLLAGTAAAAAAGRWTHGISYLAILLSQIMVAGFKEKAPPEEENSRRDSNTSYNVALESVSPLPCSIA